MLGATANDERPSNLSFLRVLKLWLALVATSFCIRLKASHLLSCPGPKQDPTIENCPDMRAHSVDLVEVLCLGSIPSNKADWRHHLDIDTGVWCPYSEQLRIMKSDQNSSNVKVLHLLRKLRAPPNPTGASVHLPQIALARRPDLDRLLRLSCEPLLARLFGSSFSQGS